MPKYGEWRSIETAPEGEKLLVCGSKRLEYAVAQRNCFTGRADEWTIETCSSVETINPPKWWMPLPAPPCG